MLAKVLDYISFGITDVCFGEIRLKAKEDDVRAWFACNMPFATRESATISITVLMVVISSMMLVKIVSVAVLRIVVTVGIVSRLPLIIRRIIVGVIVLKTEH